MNEKLNFILDSIKNNPNDSELGAEIRAMKLTLFQEAITSQDPLFELLFALVDIYPNDSELGSKMRGIQHKIKEYMNA